jgi:exonuclease SbcD
VKVIHTADWHLGKIIFQTRLIEDQKEIINDFIKALAEEKPDALIIAGDVYDRAAPPSEAVELLDNTLKRIIFDLKIPLFMIAGNHDSAERIHFGSEFMKSNGLFVRGKLEKIESPVTLYDEWGKIDFYLLPYLDPSEAKEYLKDEDIHTHNQAYEKIIKNISENMNKDNRSVLIAHAFVAGGEESDSERPLSVGGSGIVSVSVFEPFDYTALGHLHRPQTIGKKVHYSGSLMKYSFSEASHEKGYSVVEIDGDGKVLITKKQLKPQRNMRVIKGSMADLLKAGRKDENRDDFIMAVIENEKTVMNPIGRLREVYPNIMKLERNYSAIAADSNLSVKGRESKNDIELFESFFEHVSESGEAFTDDMRDAVSTIFNEIYKEGNSK